ncbi:four helix bundle protein [Balneola sp. MJW-20]|uniref:four helix bundle protein n=1 Tax=Gracilimonas aurantiaca TaxID=3234185 RepID=UPI003465808F
MINQFEDLRCWQESRELVSIVYKASSRKPLSRDFALRDQLRRAAISVMNNIAEGFGRLGDREKIYFFNIAQSSATEVCSMIYLLEDLKYLDNKNCMEIRVRYQKCRVLILALIKSQKS